MNWLDLVFILFLAASVATSVSKGLARELIGLVAAVAGLICGAWFYRLAAEPLVPYVGSQEIANLYGFLIIFIGALILGWLVSKLAGMLLKVVGLSWLDRLLGAAFGAARGIVICVALITALVAFTPGKDSKDPPQAVLNSRIAPYLVEAAHALSMAAPRELHDQFARHYAEIKRVWQDAMKQGRRHLPQPEI